MKVYTEVNYIWKDNKLVQTDSKSYEYEGEVTKCDERKGGPSWARFNIPHSHGTTSVADIIPDNPADLIDNTLNLGGDIISGGVDLGLDVFNEGVSTVTGGMDFNDIMNVSTNIFAETGNVLGKGGLFTNNLINGVVNGDWTGASVGKHGLFGLGTPNIGIPSYGGATSPNFGDLGAGKFGENMDWLGGKLSGKGYLHDRLEAFSNWSRESLGHVWNFIQYPKEYMVNDKLANMLLNQSGIVSAFGSSSGDDGGGDDGTSKYVKGRGTMKGRSPTLKLNKGGKGLGRKSLRIGTKGMGEPVGGKFQTWKSGQYTRVH